MTYQWCARELQVWGGILPGPEDRGGRVHSGGKMKDRACELSRCRNVDPEMLMRKVSSLRQWPLTFLAPGTSFMEDHFPWTRVRWVILEWLRLITFIVHFISAPTLWTWVRASSGSWWWTGKLGVLQSVGSQRVGHDWVTELNLFLLLFHWLHNRSLGIRSQRLGTPALRFSKASAGIAL